MKRQINESSLFPSEFSYKDELEVYKRIGIEKYKKGSNKILSRLCTVVQSH